MNILSIIPWVHSANRSWRTYSLLMPVFCVCFQFLPAHANALLSDPIRIKGGTVSGVPLEDGIRAYKGIPFAAPPVGDLRWRPPQEVTPWKGVRQCVEFGPACVQPELSKMISGRYENTSEDCLYLNVWTPARDPGDKLPVMVWYHGGAFMTGSASDDFYDGRDLARQGVIVVTTNYRLGPFGFMAHPLLSKESPHKVSGNYGLLDQIATLQWVRDNIRAFGGDPDRVTIFGESGGGRSVAHLMVCPLAEGLFHRAIMQSSTVYRPIHHLRQSWYGRPPMETVGVQVARRLGCDRAPDPIAALRAKGAQEILDASDPSLAGFGLSKSEGTPFEPIADGWLIPDDPSDLFDAGRQHKVPVIAGSNADEGTLFLGRKRLRSLRKVRDTIRKAFPENPEAILNLYPVTTQNEAHEALNQLSGDMSCACPMRSIVRNMEKRGSKAWLYYFSHVRADLLGKMLGAWHGSEIRFVFNSLDRGKTRVTDKDRYVARIMSACWVRFAATGDPNGPGLPRWPSYTRGQEYYLEFGDRVQSKQGLKKAACDILGKIEADRRAKRRR